MAKWNPAANKIFLQTLEIDSPELRRRYLDQACGSDADLRAEVESLLAAHANADSLLDHPAFGIAPTIEQPVAEKPGTVIGRYKLLEQIGEGGFGVVFMAEQEEPVRRRVALKIIKPGMDTKEVIARFEAERQALAIMDHPNIAKVLDAGATESGKPFFVMELVRGIPITTFCDQNNLATRERLELFSSVCQAVQHAHQKGIIHRDIKPSNVMVTLRDDRPVPKVIDFGVAKATNQRLTEKTVFTRFAQMIGTPLYMSPEQAGMSEVDIDTRSDIYSLGVLLYELLTGTTPFDQGRLREAAYDELLRIIREEEPPRPSQRITTLGDTLPSVAAQRKVEPKKLSTLFRGELDWIVMKALEKDRTRRYETANGFASDVQRYLNDEPVVACPPSRVYRLRKFVRHNRATMATVLAVALALIVGAGIATRQAIRATKAEHQAKQQERLANKAAEREKQLRIEAESQRQRALANLRLALEAIDEVYVGVMRRQQSNATSPKTKDEALLQSTLKFYEQFANANRAASDSWSLVEETFRKLLAIRKFLVEQSPHVLSYRRALATATVGLAAVLESEERLDEARATYEQAAREQKDLAETFPTVSEYRSDLAATHGKLADLLATRGKENLADEHRQLAVSAQSASPTMPVPIRFADFSDTSGLELLAPTAVVDGRLRLTPAEHHKIGACWLVEKQPVAFGFETTFQYQLSGGADGFAFVVQNSELSRVEPVPYEMPNTVAIEFDTFVNPYDNIPGDHVSVQSNGTEKNSRRHTSSLGAVCPGFEFDDGNPHTVNVRYVPGTLEIYLDGSTDPKLTVPLELSTLLALDNGRAWVGFVAWTGGRLLQTHDILSWEFRSLVDEPAATAFLRAYPPPPAHQPPTEATAEEEQAEEPGPSPPSPEDSAFLEKALAFYSQFSEQNRQDPDAQWEIGKACWRVSNIEDSLGNEEEAERARQQASETWAAFYEPALAKLDETGPYLEKSVDLGEFLASERHYDEALAVCDQTLKARPDDPRCQQVKAKVLVERGALSLHNIRLTPRLDAAFADTTAAIDLLEARLREHPDDAEARALASRAYRERGNAYKALSKQGSTKYREAIADLTRSLQLDPTNTAARFSRIEAYVWGKQFDKCFAECDKILRSNPEHVGTLYNRAMAYRFGGQYHKAIADFNEVSRLDPNNGGVFTDRALAYLKLGDLDRALADSTEAIRRIPNNFYLFADRGRIYAQMGKFDLAIADHTRAIELNPQYAEGLLFRGQSYAAMEKWDLAVADYTEAIRLSPERYVYYFRRGQAEAGLGQTDLAQADYAKAIELCSESIERDPENWYRWNLRGVVYAKLGLHEKATTDYSRAIELKRVEPQPWNNRAHSYCGQGRWSDAAADYSKAIELGHDTATMYYRLALAELGAKDAGGYQATCAEMLKRFGDSETVADNDLLSWTCALSPGAIGDYGPIVRLAERVLTSDPDSDKSLTTLGGILYRAGRHEEAVKRLTEANDLVQDPDSKSTSSPAYTWYLLAMSHHKLGHDEEAKTWLGKANEWTDTALADDKAGTFDLSWNRRLTLKLFREEAEGMIGAGKVDPAPQEDGPTSESGQPGKTANEPEAEAAEGGETP